MFIFLMISGLAWGQLVGPHCHIKSIKKSVGETATQKIGMSADGKPIFQATHSSHNSADVGLIILAVGRSASVEVTTNLSLPNETPLPSAIPVYRNITLKNEVKVNCKAVTFNSMELDIEVTNEKTKLSTSVSLRPGSPVNLGGIVSDLYSKNKNIDLSKGISSSESNGTTNFEYWLEAN
jgi:hypothetical protein